MRTLFFAFFFLVNVCYAQSGLQVGDDARQVPLNGIINAENVSAKVGDYESKIVILDFWATWCGPCIQSLPHIEGLQKEFPEEIKVFTVNQSDSRSRIDRFLTKRPLGLPIVRDTAYALKDYFPHRVIPHTVVIGKNGKVAAITFPEKITPELIRELLNQKTVNLEVKKEAMDFDPVRPLMGDGSSEFLFVVNRFIPGNSSLSNTSYRKTLYENRRILMSNLGLRSIYEIAWQIPAIEKTTVEVKDPSKFEWNEANLYSIDLILPEALGEKRFDILQYYLNLYFPYKVEWEKRLANVKLLRKKAGVEFALADTGKEKNIYYGLSGKGLKAENAGIEALVELLNFNKLVGKTVFDETGLTGTYNFDVPYYLEDRNNIYKELDKLGLELIDSKKEMTFWYIRDK